MRMKLSLSASSTSSTLTSCSYMSKNAQLTALAFGNPVLNRIFIRFFIGESRTWPLFCLVWTGPCKSVTLRIDVFWWCNWYFANQYTFATPRITAFWQCVALYQLLTVQTALVCEHAVFAYVAGKIGCKNFASQSSSCLGAV